MFVQCICMYIPYEYTFLHIELCVGTIAAVGEVAHCSSTVHCHTYVPTYIHTGYPKDIRSHMDKLETQENAQIARICDISNPNTEVIYVSPVVLSEDLESYNLKLLSLGQEGTQTEDICKRLTLITPESLGKFRGKNLSLSTVLLYSPKAMRRIRNLTRGKNAYILPGVVSEDDLAVADQLGLPILGTDPNTVQLYSSRKAGAIKLFTAAKVSRIVQSMLACTYVHTVCVYVCTCVCTYYVCTYVPHNVFFLSIVCVVQTGTQCKYPLATHQSIQATVCMYIHTYRLVCLED